MFIRKSRENIFKEIDEDTQSQSQEDGKRRMSISIIGLIYDKQSGAGNVWL